ncbi:MAG: glycosyltransferase [Flavobacterium johnsoniae]|nr:MAG: glycosyltransferase [Flavobacterium johnsoniae]
MYKRTKVSIIIPVYNSKKFIDECVKSLVNQTLKEIELIFVNDGSTDNTVEILKNYQKSDPRIIIISQENQGISRARNTGLGIAKGEYIGFCDHDDYINNDMFEILFNIAVNEDVDIVVSKTILGRDNKEIIKKTVFPADVIYDKKFIQEKIIPNLLEKEDLFPVWNKIYRRSLIESNEIKFPANRDIEEDNMFNLYAFNKSDKAYFVDYGGYHFREMEVSESRKYIEKDYFKYALEKYNFDYKGVCGLQMESNQIENLKAIRFMRRIFYLTFACAIEKGNNIQEKYQYISKMVFNTQSLAISKKHHLELYNKSGIFEKLILRIMQKESKKGLYILVNFVAIVYKPWLSEVLRFFNGNSK